MDPYIKLKEFFCWSIRRSFQDLQIKDLYVIDYLTDLLVHFSSNERLYCIKNCQGNKLETVVDMLMEANLSKWDRGNKDQQRARETYKHIGDYILFMTGIFKEYVEKHGCLNFYFSEGGSSYRYVFNIDKENYKPGAFLFLALSQRLEFFSGGL